MAGLPCYQLQKHQQQQKRSNPYMNFVPIHSPIPFFSSAALPDQQFAPLSERRKKSATVRDFLEGSSHVSSSIDFLQADTSAVSTGLGLALDDRHLTAAGSSSVVDSPSLSLLPPSSIHEEIGREIQRQNEEMDRFIKSQGERLRQQIQEKVQANQIKMLASIEEKFLYQIREKEAAVDEINRKNAELEDQLKQLGLEVAAWQHRAKYNENMITSLKFNLKQAHENLHINNNEGCGESEVDDTASCFKGGGDSLLAGTESKDMKELMTCKVCRSSEACMLLLPCRHLCLCKECEVRLSFCPLCHCSKLFGTEIYM